MRCDHCGKEIDWDSGFCKFCGNAVVRQPDAEGISERINEHCHQKSSQENSVSVKKNQNIVFALLLIVIMPLSLAAIGTLESSAQSFFTSNSNVSEAISQTSAENISRRVTEQDIRRYALGLLASEMRLRGLSAHSMFFVETENSYETSANIWVYESSYLNNSVNHPFAVQLQITNADPGYRLISIEADFMSLPKDDTSQASKSPPVQQPSTPKNAETISYDEYTKIETGMTYDEVCKIVGSYGYEMARTEMVGYQTVIVAWDGEGSIGANANVTFQNGKVIAKAQAGLR